MYLRYKGVKMSQKGPKRINHAAAGVMLRTWGTESGGGNGMAHFLDSELLGGNVGHASLEVTFPADKAGEELIAKYCRSEDQKQTIVPFERRTIQVLDENKKVKNQEVYKVYFSWWPGNDKGFRINPNVNSDAELERFGVDAGPMAKRFTQTDGPDVLIQEERISRGKVGSKKVKLAPNEITADVSSLSSEDRAYLKARSKVEAINRKIEALGVIVKKLPSDAENVRVVGSLGPLLDNNLPNWKTVIGLADDAPRPRSLNQAQIAQIKAAIETQKASYETEKAPHSQVVKQTHLTKAAEQMQKTAEELELLQAIYADLPERDQKSMRQKQSTFSSRAWHAFELAEIQREADTLNPFLSFIAQHYDMEGESKEAVLNALFSNKLSEHIELEALNQKLIGVDNRLNAIEKQLIFKTQELQGLDKDPIQAEKVQKNIDTLNKQKSSLQEDIAKKARLESIMPEIDKQLAIIQAGFKRYLPPQYAGVTRETMTVEALNAAKFPAMERRKEMTANKLALEDKAAILTLADPLLAGDNQRFVTRGINAEVSVGLPVGGIHTGERATPGLNVEDMLAKMRALTEDGVEFDLNTKNCSVTTGAILAAGAEPQLRSYMEKQAWGSFGNPQAVLNGAEKYHDVIIHNKGKMPFVDKLARFNPLNAVTSVGGKVLKGLVDPAVSTPAKIALGMALVPVGLVVGVVEGGKAIANPLRTFNNSVDFVQYAWKSNSVTLKVLSAPAAMMAGIMSPFAAVQQLTKTAVIDPISHAMQSSKSQYALANDPYKAVNVADPAVANRAQRIVTVSGNTPESIINEMARVLENHRDAIPELSASARKAMNGNLNDNHRNRLDEIQKEVRTRAYNLAPPANHEVAQSSPDIPSHAPAGDLLSNFHHVQSEQRNHHHNEDIEPIERNPNREHEPEHENSSRSNRR